MYCLKKKPLSEVAPFAGAWIEILIETQQYKSLIVAPFAGAWIEIGLPHFLLYPAYGRSLRGSVD